jgi:hypothetical protein
MGVNQISFDICGGSSTQMLIPPTISNVILDHLFGNQPILVPPPIFYMGVSSTPISTSGVGYQEPPNPDYSRLVLPNDKNTFTMAANKAVTFTQNFSFPNSQTAWGQMNFFIISDSPVTGAGNLWFAGELLHSRTVEVSTTLVVLSGSNGFNFILDSCQM